MPKIPGRWPIHPVPYVDESLLSWIMRIAKIYEIYPEDFLKYEFDIELKTSTLYVIDINPPVSLLDKLSERTGVDIDKIRALTVHSYVPLLIDALEPPKSKNEDNPHSFSDYVNQFNVFPRKKRPYSNENTDLVMANDWIPWFDTKRFANTFGCASCLKEDKEPYLRLYWRFPWMMTCPFHKELLKQVKLYNFTNHIEFYGMYDTERLLSPIDNLYMIDEITLQAITKGFVKTPAGYLHSGVWLRLLRSLIEELSLLQKNIHRDTLELMKLFWQIYDLPHRGGVGRYKVYEEHDSDKQIELMLVASSVLQSIFKTHVKWSTIRTKLLTPQLISKRDLESVHPTYFVKPPFVSESISSLTNDVLTSMRSDPKVVEEFRNIISAFDKSGKSLVGIDECLRELGIEIMDNLR